MYTSNYYNFLPWETGRWTDRIELEDMLVNLVGQLVVLKSLQFLEICVSAKARELFEDVPYFEVRGGSSPANKKICFDS